MVILSILHIHSQDHLESLALHKAKVALLQNRHLTEEDKRVYVYKQEVRSKVRGKHLGRRTADRNES